SLTSRPVVTFREYQLNCFPIAPRSISLCSQETASQIIDMFAIQAIEPCEIVQNFDRRKAQRLASWRIFSRLGEVLERDGLVLDLSRRNRQPQCCSAPIIKGAELFPPSEYSSCKPGRVDAGVWGAKGVDEEDWYPALAASFQRVGRDAYSTAQHRHFFQMKQWGLRQRLTFLCHFEALAVLAYVRTELVGN